MAQIGDFKLNQRYLPVLLPLLLVISTQLCNAVIPVEWEYPARCWEWINNRFEVHLAADEDLHGNALALSKTFETDPPGGKYKNKGTAGQDLMVVDVFNDMNNGYFVDLAANQYQDSSNTWLIETWSHWRGICIEANPLYKAELMGFRRCKLFINPVSSVANQQVRFRAEQKGGAGIVNPEYMNKGENPNDLILNTTTLELILDFAGAPSTIQYLSLDIEGAEYAAMVNFPFHRYVFLMITVERPTAQLHRLFAQHGYHYVRVMAEFGEVLYFHRAMPDFHKLMMKHGSTDMPAWDPKTSGDGYVHANRPYLLHPHYPGFSYDNQTLAAVAEHIKSNSS